jgi:hypothetical protein
MPLDRNTQERQDETLMWVALASPLPYVTLADRLAQVNTSHLFATGRRRLFTASITHPHGRSNPAFAHARGTRSPGRVWSYNAAIGGVEPALRAPKSLSDVRESSRRGHHSGIIRKSAAVCSRSASRRGVRRIAGGPGQRPLRHPHAAARRAWPYMAFGGRRSSAPARRPAWQT